MQRMTKTLIAACMGLLALTATAQEAVLRKNLGDRYPQLKNIDEVKQTGIPGVFELRVNGADILYTDSLGQLPDPGHDD